MLTLVIYLILLLPSILRIKHLIIHLLVRDSQFASPSFDQTQFTIRNSQALPKDGDRMVGRTTEVRKSQSQTPTGDRHSPSRPEYLLPTQRRVTAASLALWQPAPLHVNTTQSTPSRLFIQ